ERDDERLGAPLVLRELATGREVVVPDVESYAFSRSGEATAHLAYAVAASGGEGNGVFLRRLTDPDLPEVALRQDARGRYTALAWTEERAGADRLGFVAAVDDEQGHPGDGTLHVWDGELRAAVGLEGSGAPAAPPEGWFVPSTNELAWSRDGERLFFGLKPEEERSWQIPPDERDGGEDAGVSEEAAEGEGGEGEEAGEAGGEGGEEEPFDPYDEEAILETRGVDVWHWDDPLILPHQKEQWDEEKDRTYRAVYHLAEERLVPLADREMRRVDVAHNPHAALGLVDGPYRKEITWDGWYHDLYRVSLEDGSKQLVARRVRGWEGFGLSPGGRYVVYWREPHWHLFDGETGETRVLTEGLDVPFADEDHDFPEPADGYGVVDWVAEGPDGGPLQDRAVLLYDKFDVWEFPLDGGEPFPVTGGAGRRDRIVYRVVDLDPPDRERDHVAPGERLLMTAYDDREKHRGIAEARVGEEGVRSIEEARGKYFIVRGRAADAERLLYTRESYTEYPDLWVADLAFEDRRKLSDAGSQVDPEAWGEAELVEWTSADGTPLQGILIKPAGYEEGERYPVLVYFYRLFTSRLHRFNEPVVNHRPSFPHYASHGYAIFLPDVRFEVGRPGLAATKALVSGVQKLIDTGVADPDAVGLHGHSWSGYQAAFVVTQTDLFAAAVAGAPVSNMTSAYGGIRYNSGFARMLQYEQGQSRLGPSLWEGRDRYIENSPLFYADRVDTPLLMMFGDEDGAVPWTQGIEMYLAMRRLGKEAYFLQYRGEDHHLAKYGNKLDYSIKMREFFDHHLKGAPMPEWMAEGVPYRGE
ncbi:MAG: prolyl oligopeptidase family serine peptidase, partial [Thermoanaerobaculia bacterium]